MRGTLLVSEAKPIIPFRYLLALAGLSFMVAYAAVMASLVTVWSNYSLYSHGFVVPLIAGWLGWTRYQNSPPIPRTPDYVLGIPMILLGIGLMMVGQIGSLLTIRQSSLIVALAGFILVFFGRKTLAFYRFPFAYLLFMIPVWDLLLNQLQDPSRILSAKLATGFLHLVNVPVLRQETLLVLPTVTLSVMRQCSGVNQLVAMLAMIVPASYVFLTSNARRFAIVAFSIMVVYGSNGFRIALVGWLAARGLSNGDLAASYTHVLEGLVVSGIGYVVIIAALSWLARFNGSPVTVSQNHRTGEPSLSSTPPRRHVLDFAVIAALLGAGGLPVVGAPRDVQLTRSLGTLPSTLGEWRAIDSAASALAQTGGVSEDLVGAYQTSAGVRRFAGVDDEISRTYKNASPVRVQMYIGYYRQQVEGRELYGDAGHVLDAASKPVSFTVGSDTVTAREVIRSEEGLQRGVVYWYDINGEIVSDPYLAKAHTIWNGLTRQRTNGAVIMITWESARDATADGRAQALAFAHDLLPVVRTYFDGSGNRRTARSLDAPAPPRQLPGQ